MNAPLTNRHFGTRCIDKQENVVADTRTHTTAMVHVRYSTVLAVGASRRLETPASVVCVHGCSFVTQVI